MLATGHGTGAFVPVLAGYAVIRRRGGYGFRPVRAHELQWWSGGLRMVHSARAHLVALAFVAVGVVFHGQRAEPVPTVELVGLFCLWAGRCELGAGGAIRCIRTIT